MSPIYWLGVITTPILVGLLYALLWGSVHVCWWLKDARGWFVETGEPPEPESNDNSIIVTRRLLGATFGLYRGRRSGSRWVAFGRFLSVGRNSRSLKMRVADRIEGEA